ncbi:MAG: hypothetical protein U5N26_09130 [Candidatus Marinimicrobia bacterium]|nr:hypothetical protein [Candidatus Neomarinimicrobiota bacterium]
MSATRFRSKTCSSSASQDWNGQELMTLSVSDAEYTVSCDPLAVVVPVNDPPPSFALSSPSEGVSDRYLFHPFQLGSGDRRG